MIATLWSHVPLRGSLPILYLGLFFFLLSTVGKGLMISLLSVTQQQGLLGVFLQATPFRLPAAQLWPMAVIGICTMTAAGILFRRRMY